MPSTADPVLAYLLDDLCALAPFGVATEVTLVVGDLAVTGTPIADDEYFRVLGERFRKVVDAVSDLLWARSRAAEWERKQGWTEEQLARLGFDRECGYVWVGEQAQQAVRERAQRRPQHLWGSPADEQRRSDLERLAQILGDRETPERAYVALKGVAIRGRVPTLHLPFFRVRLGDVSAWDLGAAATAEPGGQAN